jgi:hypothetical protein
MGLGKRWRRLIARLFGGGIAGDCDVCAGVISRADLEHGRAVILARQKFCKVCVEYVTDHPRRRLIRPTGNLESSTTAIFGA